MSQNTHSDSQRTRVFTTTPGRVIMKHILKWAAVGLLLGVVVMVALGLGIHNRLLASASDEFVAYAASNETAPQYSDKTIDLTGITFEFEPVVYNGEEHVAEIKGTLPEGVTVTYYHNRHTNAGVHLAVAVLDGVGYEPATLYTEMIIDKADITGVTFVGGVFEFVEGKTYSATFTGDLPEGATVTFENEVTSVGEHVVKAIINGGINYNSLTLEANVYVVNLHALVSFPENTTFTYDTTEHVVELDTSAVPEYVEDFKVEYTTANKATNAGTYEVVATVSAKGFTSFEVKTTMTVNKGDLEAVAGLAVSGVDCVFDGNLHSATHTELPEGVSAEIKYFLGETEVNADEVVKPGTYKAVLTFTDANGNYEAKTLKVNIVIDKASVADFFTLSSFYGKYKLDANDNAVERIAEVKYDAEHIAVLYGGAALDITYYYNGEELEEAPKFTEVGTYEVKAVVKGNELYKDTELVAVIDIRYASYDHEVEVETKQFGVVSLTASKYVAPDEYKKINGAKVEYLLNGEVVEGVKQAGIYNMQVRITSADGNYQSVKNVTFFVVFNPLIALVIMLAFAFLGAIVGIINVLVNSNKERYSENHFVAPSAAVAKVRSGVICESYAKYDNKKIKGRLYLSNLTLEFYSDDYKSGQENFLINLADIRNVSAISANKIQIYANREVHVFTVPGGRAADWANQILNA